MNGVENVPLNVAMYVIPHEKLIENKTKAKDAHIIKKKSQMQGLYFYRNDRIIQYGGWHDIYSELDTLQLARCSIDIPPEYNEYFGVSPYKLAVEPAPAIFTKLQEIFAEERDWGKLYKSPEQYRMKSYLHIAKKKSGQRNHGIAAQRYTAEGIYFKENGRHDDDDEPFESEQTTLNRRRTPPTPPPLPPPLEDDEPNDEDRDDEEQNTTTSFYSVINDTQEIYSVEISKTHPEFNNIKNLIEQSDD